jgi:hypothetical protein
LGPSSFGPSHVGRDGLDVGDVRTVQQRLEHRIPKPGDVSAAHGPPSTVCGVFDLDRSVHVGHLPVGAVYIAGVPAADAVVFVAPTEQGGRSRDRLSRLGLIAPQFIRVR